MRNRAEIILKKIKKSKNIFIMGHKNIDLDALGACVSISSICKKNRRKSYIILQDSKYDESIKKAIEYLKEKSNFIFLKYKEAIELVNSESLCIIVDTYSERRCQSFKLFNKIKNRLIIDHHLFGKPINNDYIIDTKVSSTCELILKIFKNKKIKFDKYTATVMLAGIIIDTNNYSIKTTPNTFDSAKLLLKLGAENTIAHGFNKVNMEEYQKIQKVIFKTEFYKKKYAFVKCDSKKIYDREDLAKICDTLLMFENVEVAFAIGFVNKDEVGCSARSVKENVADIMSKFDGGGHKFNAACQLKSITQNELVKKIKEVLK